MIGEDTAGALLAVLDDERDQIDDLHYHVVALHRLVEAGDLELLDRANAEVALALDRIRETELLRGVLVAALLHEHGREDLVGTLADVLAVVADGDRPHLIEVTDHLARRTEEIERLAARTNRRADVAADELEDWGAVLGAPSP
ncbi:MAG: hypothetical protein AAGA99_24440 [Actinomycetota bacterium]